MSARPVTLYIDPICPFAWMTSRWLLHAAEVREIAPTFSVMSLAVLNEDKDLDAGYRRAMDDAWGPARVALAIERTRGQEDFAAFYTAFGEDYHVGGSGDRRASVRTALAAAGLPAELNDAYDVTDRDQDLRDSQAKVIDLVGDDVGTPVISFGEGVAYFGPVLSPAPRGEDAGKLFDAVSAASEVPGFFELKRSRTGGIDFS
ncbi:mycothiol-dependent nitroreductase Rv2466c family protein [Brachybacterium sp. AOP25-B2-12]|uniref:mycothiol-dependent nitroreductase Rv2466c family protein n=1 Tax=Brachybacterium sp. AOP25-B2-12 TaxID=3457710 RepID=UPI004034E528